MKRPIIARILPAALVILAFSACAPAKAPDKPAAAADTSGPPFTPDDVHFMQGMIGHHAQAVIMAGWAPTHGASADVALLCKRIDNSQRSEIGIMRTWLADRKQAVPDSNDAHPMMMPGMLTADQMAQLDKARGAEFDRLFLTFMIQHHQGALDMVAELRKSPRGGQAAEMSSYATDVETSQRAEIARMTSMLNTKGS